MSLRFHTYEALEGFTDPRVVKVVNCLNGSYVRDVTAIDLLSALAAQGSKFVVACYGDYDVDIDSTNCMPESVDPESADWLKAILEGE